MAEIRYINLRLTPELHEWVRSKAKERQKPMTTWIRDMLLDKMEAEPTYKALVRADAKVKATKHIDESKPKTPERIEIPPDEWPIEEQWTQKLQWQDGVLMMWRENPLGEIEPGSYKPAFDDTPKPSHEPVHEHIPAPGDPKGRRLYRRLEQLEELVEREIRPHSLDDYAKYAELITSDKRLLRDPEERQSQYENVEALLAGRETAIEAAIKRLTGAEVED